MPSPSPVLALVHGWGMNAHVFDTLAGLLADDFEVRALDLPGHGGREPLVNDTLQSWSEDLAQQLPDGATLLGWSLGGQVAMRAALDHPERIARLVLLAATPRFVATDDWPHAVALQDLSDFGAALLADTQATLLRFLTLQTRGMEGQKAMLQQLRQTMLAAPQPQHDALSAGLEMLLTTDLRDAAKQLRQPALMRSRRARYAVVAGRRCMAGRMRCRMPAMSNCRAPRTRRTCRMRPRWRP
jgi:pimeloyl-[acyl-carrier protein] methyl ester esterase